LHPLSLFFGQSLTRWGFVKSDYSCHFIFRVGLSLYLVPTQGLRNGIKHFLRPLGRCASLACGFTSLLDDHLLNQFDIFSSMDGASITFISSDAEEILDCALAGKTSTISAIAASASLFPSRFPSFFSSNRWGNRRFAPFSLQPQAGYDLLIQLARELGMRR
jgi:hypothetical protein